VLAEPLEPVRPAELVTARQAFAEPIGAAETIARFIGKCRRLRSSVVVREIEAPFVLTLGETETPCVLAIAETGLTLSETSARSTRRAHAF
jgi:hypothetical protein